MWNKIKCPCCDTGEININLQVLSSGKAFPCNNCGASISVADKSQEMVRNGVDTFIAMQKDSVGFDRQKTH
jgi:hypothetical protein